MKKLRKSLLENVAYQFLRQVHVVITVVDMLQLKGNKVAVLAVSTVLLWEWA